MPFDQFAGELINDARLDPVGGVARPEPRLYTISSIAEPLGKTLDSRRRPWLKPTFS